MIALPNKSYKPCSKPGCKELVRNTLYCANHTPQRQYSSEKRNNDNQKFYNNTRWRKARKRYLMRQPLCVECRKHNILTMGKVVDHIIPHKGDINLFWDESNWQSLCVSCHNRKTAKHDGAFGNKGKEVGGNACSSKFR